MREYAQGYEWELLKCDYAGVPLKHFVDHFATYSPIENDASEGGQHAPFFPGYIGELSSNRIESFEPEQCPQLPQAWRSWHQACTIDELRDMPLKTSFQLDVTNFVKDPAPMQPMETKNLLTYTTYLISPDKVVVT